MPAYRDVLKRLSKSSVARTKFIGNAISFLESQGIEVTDEVLKRTRLLDEKAVNKAFGDPTVAGVLLL